MGGSNQGFVNLHNTEGVTLVAFAAMLLIAMIVFGVILAKQVDLRQREERQRMKAEIEASQHPTHGA